MLMITRSLLSTAFDESYHKIVTEAFSMVWPNWALDQPGWLQVLISQNPLKPHLETFFSDAPDCVANATVLQRKNQKH